LSRSVVRDVLDHYGIEYDEVRSSRSDLFYYCPFHSHTDEKMGSSRFNEDDEVFYCFACGEGGNIYQFVMKMEKCSAKVAESLIESNFKTDIRYDLSLLESTLDRKFHVLTKKSSKDEITIVNRWLSLFSSDNVPISLFEKYYPVIVRIYNNKISENELTQMNIINLYSSFLEELNNRKD